MWLTIKAAASKHPAIAKIVFDFINSPSGEAACRVEVLYPACYLVPQEMCGIFGLALIDNFSDSFCVIAFAARALPRTRGPRTLGRWCGRSGIVCLLTGQRRADMIGKLVASEVVGVALIRFGQHRGIPFIPLCRHSVVDIAAALF